MLLYFRIIEIMLGYNIIINILSFLEYDREFKYINKALRFKYPLGINCETFINRPECFSSNNLSCEEFLKINNTHYFTRITICKIRNEYDTLKINRLLSNYVFLKKITKITYLDISHILCSNINYEPLLAVLNKYNTLQYLHFNLDNCNYESYSIIFKFLQISSVNKIRFTNDLLIIKLIKYKEKQKLIKEMIKTYFHNIRHLIFHNISNDVFKLIMEHSSNLETFEVTCYESIDVISHQNLKKLDINCESINSLELPNIEDLKIRTDMFTQISTSGCRKLKKYDVMCGQI